MAATYPGYETLTSHLTDLVSTFPPPFIYIHDPTTQHSTTPMVTAVLSSLADSSSTPSIAFACANAVACFTPRLLYDTILNRLAKYTPVWEVGSQLWGADSGQRWNDSVDAFIHGLKTFVSENRTPSVSGENDKDTFEGPRIVILIERAERLKTSLPDLIVPLTRLSELAQLDLSVIFVSDVPWQQIKPSLGASPDPFHVQVPVLTKHATLQTLAAQFLLDNSNSHHPALRPLHAQFLSTLYDTCAPFTKDVRELSYVAAARWPGFVRPVLDEYTRLRQESRDNPEMEDQEFTAPTEDARMRLLRFFTPTFTVAFDALYPRLTNAADWARDNQPPENLFTQDFSAVTLHNKIHPPKDIRLGIAETLPRVSKFILIASFLASTNLQKSDMRMFGRGPEERKKRRKRGGTSESKKGGAIKIPQRLLGPMPFPVDRMLSILGVLLEEYDADERPPAQEYTLPGEYTEMEIQRVSVYSSVMELTSMRLLHRTTPPERLDGPSMFKCGISYEAALELARNIQVPLPDLMWEPV